MTDSSRLPPWMKGELPQPETDAAIRRTFRGYREALARLTIPQLIALADRQAAELQQIAEQRKIELMRSLSSESSSSIDQLVPRTTPLPSTAERSPRGQAALASPSQPPDQANRRPSPRGRALAAKLVAAGARSVAHRRVR